MHVYITENWMKVTKKRIYLSLEVDNNMIRVQMTEIGIRGDMIKLLVDNLIYKYDSALTLRYLSTIARMYKVL